MGDISFINESFCPDNEVDNCGSPTDDSTDVVDQTQKNGVAPQIQDSQSNNNSLAQKQLQLMPKSQKIGRTTCVTLMYLCEGLYIAIMGPTLPDFRSRLGATTDQISLAAGCRDAGGIVGCIIGGMLADRFRNHVDLEVAMALFVSGLFCALKPWMPGVPGLACMGLLEGFGYGTSDAIGAAMLFWVWGEEGSVPVIISLIGYPIGTVFAPILAAPFLGTEYNTSANFSGGGHDLPGPWNNPFDQVPELSSEFQTVGSRIEIPFAIIGGVTFLSGLPFLLFYFARPIKKYVLWGEKKTSFREVFDVKTCSHGMGGFGIIMVILTCIYWIMWGSIEASLSLFLYTYAVDTDLDFSSQEASWLTFTYRLSAVIGTAISAVATKYCPIQAIMFTLSGLLAAIMVCLVTIGKTSKVYFWVFTNLANLLYIPMYGDFVSWVSKYMVVYSILMSLYVVSYSLSMFSMSWLTGYLYEEYTPDSMLYVSLAASLGVCLIMTILQVVASVNDRHKAAIDISEEEDSGGKLQPSTSESPVETFSKTSDACVAYISDKHEEHLAISKDNGEINVKQTMSNVPQKPYVYNATWF